MAEVIFIADCTQHSDFLAKIMRPVFKKPRGKQCVRCLGCSNDPLQASLMAVHNSCQFDIL